MGKKIKNKDIAARLGLSGTLVSLVLNNKADQHGKIIRIILQCELSDIER